MQTAEYRPIFGVNRKLIESAVWLAWRAPAPVILNILTFHPLA